MEIPRLTPLHRFPLAEHICNLNTAVPPPSYLKSQPNTNLSSAFSDPRQRQNASGLDILSDWPSPPEDTLDQSQWAALRQMLTNSLSIVQGPPGTGKTHVSVVGLRVLVENKSSSDPPIIVAAQTNHALDQILGHISNFEDNYIRLGGRSKKPEVKKHTVYEIRKKNNVRPPLGSLLGHATRAQSELAKAMIETLGPLASAGEARPLAPDFLRNLGIITPAQAESLITHANQWVSSSVGEPQDAMLLWLNKEVIPFEVVYERDVFSYVEEEKDEEYEQLKELEAEQGIDEDEDAEYLRGPFRILEDRYTCRITLSLQKQAEVELGQKSDLWDIPQRIRGGVYRLFQDRAKAIILKSFRDQARKYVEITQNRQIGKWERDAVLLQKANVIGMTTTGFSKYRPLVASLRPKIVLIEEAAEVIESPVTVVCVESLEHLILVGDHQQLQGHCNVQELEEVFHLNVSMFERLVHNNMPFKTLTRQRRMDPEIRRALAPIYQDLEDHPAVLGRPPVPGMGEVRSFFFDHSWSEGSDSMLSKYNEQEAEFIVGFFCYLVRGGLIPPHGITVLTFYNGQRKLILKLLKQQGFLAGEYINVNTVDSYQGEENAIVLLSLVRSNEQGQIGFLAAANRVCVALSRARLGFYIFGNVSLLSQDPLWNQVIEIMSNNPNRVGDCLPIRCIKHDRLSEIQYPRDWDGRFGCNCKCGEMLECGHKCPLTCHQFSHQAVICKVECKRSLNCGHPCANRCGEDCICNHKCADFIRLSENQGRGPPSPPMEVRGNNKDGNKLHLGSGSPNPSSNHTAARPRTLAFQATVSSSNSASSDPFGRLTAEGQVQSRTNWGAYANGGVKNDDLLRDEVAEQRKQQFNEQNMHLLDINDGPLDDNGRVGDESSGPVRKQTQRALTNGRVLHHHEYVPGNGKKKRGLQNGVARTSSRSPEKEKVNEVVSLIDL